MFCTIECCIETYYPKTPTGYYKRSSKLLAFKTFDNLRFKGVPQNLAVKT